MNATTTNTPTVRTKRPPITIASIVAWVTDEFIRTGKVQTVAEIAIGLNVSDGTINKVIRDAHYFVNGLNWSEEYRTTYSRNYNWEHGAKKVRVFSPSKETLRQRILEGVK